MTLPPTFHQPSTNKEKPSTKSVHTPPYNPPDGGRWKGLVEANPTFHHQ